MAKSSFYGLKVRKSVKSGGTATFEPEDGNLNDVPGNEEEILVDSAKVWSSYSLYRRMLQERRAADV